LSIVEFRRAGKILILALLAAWPAGAATFTVGTTIDETDAAPGDGVCRSAARRCSLRAAVQEANALAGPDTIVLPAGTFVLTIPGRGEDAAATGDLDVTGELEVAGAGEAATVIDAARLDRIFDNLAGAAEAPLRITNLTVQNGEGGLGFAGIGGCLMNAEGRRLELERVTVRGCLCSFLGCGLYNAGLASGEQVSFLMNGDIDRDSSRGGAGVANVGPAAQVELRDCEMRGNEAVVGAAFYTSAEFTIPNTSKARLERCSLVHNESRQGGSALANNSLTELSLLDSTVSSNVGSALFNDGGGIFLIRNSTITANHESNIGGGINEVHFNADFIRLSNSILAGNSADFFGPDCHFRIRSEGATLLGDSAACEMAPAAGDQTGVDPRLGPLENPAPRVWIHRLLPGSPAIGAGNPELCTRTDQLGNLRSRCDLGAVEAETAIFADGFESGGTGEWSAVLP
jgi:CSLREA domain-containing protein